MHALEAKGAKEDHHVAGDHLRGVYLVTEPSSAGHLMTSAFHGLGHAGRSLATFVNSLSL
jgi:hypothetical protein